MSDTKTPATGGMVLKRRERRDQGRIAHALTVQLKEDDFSTALVTQNVTKNGMFLLTETPADPREILELEIDLGEQGTLDALTVVRHVIRPEEAAPLGLNAGMGVQFYGLSASKHKRWKQYVRRVGEPKETGQSTPPPEDSSFANPAGETQERYDRSGLPSILVDTSKRIARLKLQPAPDERPPRPVSASGHPEFAVRFLSIEMLLGFQNRDMALGGFFLVTDSHLDVGTPIVVRVIHPDTDDAFFLDCEVLRSGTEDRSGRLGLSVKFVEMNDDIMRAFDEFVRVGAMEVDLDLSFTADS